MTKKYHQDASKPLNGCGHLPSKSSVGSGYGVSPEDNKHYCYECCSKRELAAMLKDGRTTLYLCTVEIDGQTRKHQLTDWPGLLVIPVGWVKEGRHNIAGVRYDVNFKVPGDEFWWHGTQYGDNTQLCHCKRTKSK